MMIFFVCTLNKSREIIESNRFELCSEAQNYINDKIKYNPSINISLWGGDDYDTKFEVGNKL